MPPSPETTGATREPRPLILLTPDFREGAGTSPGEYRLRANYTGAISEAGGSAVILAPGCDAGAPPELPGRASGLVVTGTAPGIEVGSSRLEFERSVIREALRRGLPVLGICHGMQVLGEIFGGTILRDRPELLASNSQHMPGAAADFLAHEVRFAPGSCLAQWQGGERGRVNSLHRHVLGDPGRARIIATAPDGLIEAIEGPGPGFCLGVQWHPEYRLTTLDRAIWRAFVARCAHPVAALKAET